MATRFVAQLWRRATTPVGDQSPAPPPNHHQQEQQQTQSRASVLSEMPPSTESPMPGGHLPLHSGGSLTLRTLHTVESGGGHHAPAVGSNNHNDEDEDDDDASGKRRAPPRPIREALGGLARAHWIAITYSAATVGTLILLIYFSFFAATMTGDDGAAVGAPEFLGCRDWGFGTSCGLWGVDCRPFETEWSAIRCRSRCALDQSTALAVYGSGPYRADSRICRAAIHAGVIGHNGGCALFRFSGPANSFPASTANGVTSRAYLTWFPKTFEFKAAPSRFCTDLTWPILCLGIVLLFGYAFVPRTNPAWLYALLVAWGFFYVRLVGQPRSTDYADMTISAFGEVFVLLAASSWLYYIAPVHTFAQWRTLNVRQRIVLWGLCYLVPFHVLINLNMIEYVPWLNIDLGGYEQNAAVVGTYIVLVIVVGFILVCAFQFFRELYRKGLWRRYVVWYAFVIIAVLLSWALFPHTDFHFHHTMLGAFFLPFTRFPTPLAAIAQSATLACFVQGYAAWGWGSYLDVIPTYLTIDVPEDPPVANNVTRDAVNASWSPIDKVVAYSLRLNKIEVYRGTETHAVVTGLQSNLTYFLTVAGVAEWGTDGREGPKSNFTTLP